MEHMHVKGGSRRYISFLLPLGGSLVPENNVIIDSFAKQLCLLLDHLVPFHNLIHLIMNDKR